MRRSDTVCSMERGGDRTGVGCMGWLESLGTHCVALHGRSLLASRSRMTILDCIDSIVTYLLVGAALAARR